MRTWLYEDVRSVAVPRNATTALAALVGGLIPILLELFLPSFRAKTALSAGPVLTAIDCIAGTLASWAVLALLRVADERVVLEKKLGLGGEDLRDAIASRRVLPLGLLVFFPAAAAAGVASALLASRGGGAALSG
jgi:hypothetical protein